jgi:hypothetical integral membrane protein (TIGR02206 family)
MPAFQAFSITHGIVIATLAVLTAIACILGIRWRGTARLRRLERIVGVVMLVNWAAMIGYGLMPAHFKIGEALPLQICDLTALLAPLVLLTNQRPLRALLYFWGLGLSIQAVITPTLEDGPGGLEFWLFWLTHGAILATPIYDLIARRFRPSFRDCIFAILTCAIWVLIVLGVDLWLGVNYGFIGNVRPEHPTMIDQLGPWPLRVYKMVFAAIVLLLAMWLPWGIAAKVNSRRGSARTPPSSSADRSARSSHPPPPTTPETPAR